MISKLLSKIEFSIVGEKKASLRQSMLRIKRNALSPMTIIDVGFAAGTPEISNVFPKAYYILIEPLIEHSRKIRSFLKRHIGEYHQVCAGASNSIASLNVHPFHLDGSSVLKERIGAFADGTTRDVQVCRLDKLIDFSRLLKPILLKVDVQGGELDVLEGLGEFIYDIDIIVLEVSMYEFMLKAPGFLALSNWLDLRDFDLHDVTNLLYRPLDGNLGQFDAVFAKRNSILRSDMRFATDAFYQ